MAADFKLPWIAAEEDTGPFVKALVQEKPGKNLIAYREWATLREMVQAFQNASGTRSEVVVVPRDQPNEFLPPDLKLEVDEGFLYFEEFGYEGRDDPTVIHPSQVRGSAVVVIETYTEHGLAGKLPQIGYDGAILPESRLFKSFLRMKSCLPRYCQTLKLIPCN